jgi:hypothetical protein
MSKRRKNMSKDFMSVENEISTLVRTIRSDPSNNNAIQRLESLMRRTDFQPPEDIEDIFLERRYGRKPNVWYQVGGDMSPEYFGAILLKYDKNGYIELWRIQSVGDLIGNDAAADIGRPYWVSESTADIEQIENLNEEQINQILETFNFEREWIETFNFEREWNDFDILSKTQLAVEEFDQWSISASVWGARDGESALPEGDEPIIWLSSDDSDPTGRNPEDWNEVDKQFTRDVLECDHPEVFTEGEECSLCGTEYEIPYGLEDDYDEEE